MELDNVRETDSIHGEPVGAGHDCGIGGIVRRR
jgi:hypothetical protein